MSKCLLRGAVTFLTPSQLSNCLNYSCDSQGAQEPVWPFSKFPAGGPKRGRPVKEKKYSVVLRSNQSRNEAPSPRAADTGSGSALNWAVLLSDILYSQINPCSSRRDLNSNTTDLISRRFHLCGAACGGSNIKPMTIDTDK